MSERSLRGRGETTPESRAVRSRSDRRPNSGSHRSQLWDRRPIPSKRTPDLEGSMNPRAPL
ncbi:MAG: hypothetical protein J07HX64_01023 [halophilic archaeon J07HX64]|nr:MAG: hypothetical protein J07HX64_01023 [halophilic archaeon J07HX64]